MSRPSLVPDLAVETLTVEVTKTFTISSCAPSVTKCRLGQVTTQVVTTTKTVTQHLAHSTWAANKADEAQTTRTYTVTSCAPTVVNCRLGQVITQTDTSTKTATQHLAHSTWAANKVDEAQTTRTYTVTSCAPTVTNCRLGQVTTETAPLTETPSWPRLEASVGNVVTVEVTKTFTITSCPPVVKNCLTLARAPVETPCTIKAVGVQVTKTITISSCAPSVTGCKVGQVTMQVVAATQTSFMKLVRPPNRVISTRVTREHTITSCAPTATSCAVGKVVTQTLDTSLTAVGLEAASVSLSSSQAASHSCSSSPLALAPVSDTDEPLATSSPAPRPLVHSQASAVVSRPHATPRVSCSGSSRHGINGTRHSNSTHTSTMVLVSSSSRAQISLLPVFGAMVAMMVF
ncbi:hypothetical protein CDD81_7207 [Ophiocordyceps australis]|uniref:Uncharacterized protein n=1 Tax=Ophiocordyceps australis TaxID=1399860 RepID=A0A2C5XYK9_9HYPO|nr:hypothetical protein CDD81_7207 [Ophiocordyceps australis]